MHLSPVKHLVDRLRAAGDAYQNAVCKIVAGVDGMGKQFAHGHFKGILAAEILFDRLAEHHDIIATDAYFLVERQLARGFLFQNRQRDPHFGDALLWETFGVPPTDNVIRKWRVNGDARTAGEFLPKRVDVIAQRFVRSGRRVGLGVGRFVFEAGDRECRRAWLCDIWLFLLGFGGFWFNRGRFCRAWLFCFWLSRSLFFGAWLIRVGGHRDARDRGRKAQATNQAACFRKSERSLSGHDICHSFIS